MTREIPASEADTPWSAEAEIDVDGVAQILSRDQPQLDVQQVVSLGEGWSSFVFLGDGRWVLRFPKRRDVEQRLEKETQILPRLERQLPAAVPHMAISGKAVDRFPFRYVGYEKLEGVFAWDLGDDFDEEGLARSLGGILSALHRFPIQEALAHGCEDVVETNAAASCEEIRAVFARTPPWPAREEVQNRLQAYLADLDAERLGAAARPALTHADLLPDHLLLPESRDRVSAIIDWGETRIGDPAADFAGIYYWRGAVFTKRVLAHYSGRADSAILERARLLALPVGLGDVWYGLEAGRPEYLRVGMDCVRHCLEMP